MTSILYIVLFLVSSLLLYYSYINKSFSNESIKKRYAILSFLILWFILGLQYNVGTDYHSYIRIYNEINNNGIQWALSNLRTEPLYAILNFITNTLFNHPQFIFITTSFIVLLLVYLSILREKENLNLGIALMIFLSTYYLSFFNVIRISIAIAIVVYSYKFLINKQLLKYIIALILATSFHYTAIIMLPVYFIVNNLRYYRSVVIGFIVIFIGIAITFHDRIFLEIFDGTKYMIYFNNLGNLSGGINQLILHLPLLLLVILFRKRLISYNDNNKIYLYLFYIGSVFLLITLILAIADRAAMYLLASQIFIIPQIIRVLMKKEKLLISYCIILYYGFNFARHLYNNPRYLDYSNVILESIF